MIYQKNSRRACQALPIAPWSHCSTHGISNPPALLLSLARAVLPQTPTFQTCTISAKQALKACQAGDPQTFTISARPSPQVCTGLHDLCSTGPHHQDLPHRQSIRARSPLHQAMPPRPAKPQATDIHDLLQAMPSDLHRTPQSLLGCTPHAHTGLQDLCQNHAHKAYQAGNPQTRKILIPLALTLQARQAHAPKAC
jgi:hypothetical protein